LKEDPVHRRNLKPQGISARKTEVDDKTPKKIDVFDKYRKVINNANNNIRPPPSAKKRPPPPIKQISGIRKANISPRKSNPLIKAQSPRNADARSSKQSM
jgi:hypothetical protein